MNIVVPPPPHPPTPPPQHTTHTHTHHHHTPHAHTHTLAPATRAGSLVVCAGLAFVWPKVDDGFDEFIDNAACKARRRFLATHAHARKHT
jgi:hypothetical protein